MTDQILKPFLVTDSDADSDWWYIVDAWSPDDAVKRIAEHLRADDYDSPLPAQWYVYKYRGDGKPVLIKGLAGWSDAFEDEPVEIDTPDEQSAVVS